MEVADTVIIWRSPSWHGAARDLLQDVGDQEGIKRQQLLAVYGVAKVLLIQWVVLENCVAPGVDKFGITIKYDGDLVHASTNKAMCALSLLPREERRQVLATFLCQKFGFLQRAGARWSHRRRMSLLHGLPDGRWHLDVSSSLPRRKDWQLSSYLHRHPIDDGLHGAARHRHQRGHPRQA